ncbi:MAG: DnaJ domain-containing protein [Candidatus Gastranaerophilales bacterium]|nr:DnaJ domain-containing protein [Candidatus Gastranaerophilales bacterium]
MKKKNYYNILGLNPKATTDDIKRAYRRLVHKYHPDIAGNNDESIQRFKDITEAYETLSSSQKREQYDSIMKLYEYGEDESVSSKTKSNSENDKKTEEPKEKPKQKENTFSKMRERAKSAHVKNIFSGAIDNILKNTKPKQKKYTPPKIDGKDITTEVTLSITEAINGTERVVNILHLETCEKCRGRKFINGSVCPECGGAGEKSKYKKLTVKIPARVRHNSKIRVEGEGNQGFNGGKRGDLYLHIKIENNVEIQYDGLNVLRTVSIEPYEAVLGGYIDIAMPGGNIQMKLMSNTYSGQKYRLSEQGVEKDGKKGDLIITVKIDIPKKLSKAEIALYEQLKQLSKHNIRENINE